MEATGDDPDRIVAKLINQPMLPVNPSRPATLQGMFQWFWLAYASERCALYVFDELVDFL